jgi:alpha-glucoside transport system substrate-binding protein
VNRIQVEEQMTKFRMMAPFAVLAIVLTACPAGDGDGDGGGAGGSPGAGGGGGGEEGDGEIIVTSLWGGAEEEAFQAVLDAFEEETGVHAEYEANRTDYATVLRTRIQGDNPPDVAIIPGIGFLRSFARDGSLIPLSDLGIEAADIEANYAPGILDVGVVDDELYGLMVKLNTKANIWYDPSRIEELGVSVPAEDWEDLVGLTDDIKAAGAVPWSLGAGDAWTLTDWFEITYLKEHGQEAYDTLFSPDGDWTDPTVMATIDRIFGEILTAENIEGGVDNSLATLFVDGIAKVFSTSPSAELYYEGGFVYGLAKGDVNPDLEFGTDIDWFPFPTVDGNGAGQVTYGGDVIAALVNDTDVAAFMEYMATPAAGQVWAEQGTIISPLVEVDPSVYPEAVQKEAELVTSAETLRFDGSDLLPAGQGDALGALLQAALRGEDVGPTLEELQASVTTAWEEE